MTTASSQVPARNEGALGEALQAASRRYAGAFGSSGPGYRGLPWGVGSTIAAVLGVVLLCMFWGFAIVIAEVNAVIVGVALLACVLILVDFRVGVVLLIILMPISSARGIFPHEMIGITGLNPVNLLLVGTLASYLLQALSDRARLRFIPRPLLWLYIAPFLAAGALGSRHVGEIALVFFITDQVNFTNAAGYLRDMVVKPLFFVIFALLVAAAVARTRDSQKFLVPAVISIWVMSLLVIVYFLAYGTSFDALASAAARGFLSPLGLHANDLGRLYAVAYALLLFTWAGTRDYGVKLVLLASMGLVVTALVLTFSRGAFVAFVIVNVLFLVSRRDLASLFFGAALTAGVLLFLPEALHDRLATGFGAGLNAISAGRIDSIWLPLLPDVLRSPIYGSGISSMLWSEAVRLGRSLLTSHPHNAYLRAVMDMGIVGLVLLCAYFAHVWRAFRRLSADPDLNPGQRGFFDGAAAGLASFLIAGVAGSSLTPAPEQAFLWLAIGMMYGERAGRPGT